jgi:hypothetical protein
MPWILSPWALSLLLSCWSSTEFWEWMEYIAEAVVVISAIVEFLTEFEHILKGDEKEELRHRVSKYATLALIVGLAFELGALARTNKLFSDTIASLYKETEKAIGDAGTAEANANKASDSAGKANDSAGKAEQHATAIALDLTKEEKREEQAIPPFQVRVNGSVLLF